MTRTPQEIQDELDKEFWTDTQEFFETFKQQTRLEGQQQLLLTAYTNRFGPPPEEIRLAIMQTYDEQSILRLLKLVMTSTPEAVASAIRGQI